MKINFQETIKQKTDKDLEIISKDYVFYSAEERLIALEELESRNGLTKELSMTKESLESSIDKPIITEQAIEAVKSARKIYKTRAIEVAAYLGGPLCAGYLIAENFKAFEETDKVKKTWFCTIIVTIIEFYGLLAIPDDVWDLLPKLPLPLINVAIVYFIVRHFQRKNILAFLALGGEPFSWGRTIAVSLIGTAITVASVFVFVYLYFFVNV
jgi:hypothetical protein